MNLKRNRAIGQTAGVFRNLTKLSLLLLLNGTAAIAHPGHSVEYALAEHFGDSKPSGSVSNRVSITIEGNYRVIRANGVPNHQTGQFPNRGNPNSIAAQDYDFRVPVHPQIADQPTRLRLSPFGVAVNGVVFDPGAAEWWDNDPQSGWQYEPMSATGPRLGMDFSNAHVQPTGAYHYHAVPTELLKKLDPSGKKMILVGWAADGFPIYGPWCYTNSKDSDSSTKKMKSSYAVKKGTRPDGPGGAYDGRFVADYEFVKGLGDLDECNGRTGVTPEFPQGTYYYVLTEDFPFIPRMFKGVPDPSLLRRRGGRPPGHRPPPGFGPRASLDAQEPAKNTNPFANLTISPAVLAEQEQQKRRSAHEASM